ncbi:hypothetical protein P154DRAFT_449059, partial [Amniculicola lignicola CBS 123094]
NLSASLYRRYKRTGLINNLNKAIQALRQALAITLLSCNNQVGLLNNLSVLLYR